MGMMIMMGAAEVAGNLPEPTHWATIGWLCLALAGIAATFNQVHEFWQRIQAKPSGADVQKEALETFVSRETCQLMHTAMEQHVNAVLEGQEKRLQELQRRLEQNHQDAVAGRKNLHSKMEQAAKDTTSALNEMRTELQAEMNEQRREIYGKLDGIDARLIAMLKNMGAI